MLKRIRNLDKKDRTMYILRFTLTINIILAIVKYIIAFTLPSMWFFVNALFLTVLSISRFFSIKDYHIIKTLNEDKEKVKIGYKNYLRNGILLIFLGLMYFFVSVYIYYKGTNTNMHEYLTYLVALNAFWSISWAIYGMIKYKKNNNPILKSVKMTNFANALTSMVLTQVTLLDTFGPGYDLSKINSYTGMGVSLIIAVIGLSMIIGIKKIDY
ncbi:MAG: hypothetical protein IJE53_00235 [Bacilli bacterium]|nr:hypothetical protein [Bacilli bacterium]